MGKQFVVEVTPQMRPLVAGSSLGPMPVIETVPGGAYTVVEFPDGATDEEIQQYLDRMEANKQIKNAAAAEPVKGGYRPLGEIHPLEITPVHLGETFALIGVTGDVQARGRWGAGVLLGLCDTGCDGGLSQFRDKGFTGDLTDEVGHGTGCAGIGAGSAGIASDAVVMVRNVLPGGMGDEVGVSRGIRECAEAGCKVINLSLGGGPSNLIDQACRYASSLGAIVVAAAGNDPNSRYENSSPARAADVVVLACNNAGEYAGFTSGRTWSNPNRTCAPGDPVTLLVPGGGVAPGQGTSFAAPHIWGLLALLRASGLSASESIEYLWSHRVASPGGLRVVAGSDFGADQADPEWMAQIRELVSIGRDLVSRAQFDRCAWDASYEEYQESMRKIMDEDVGPIDDVLAQIEASLPKDEGGGEEPSPPPPPGQALPLANGGVYGRTKWLPGSTGCDIFVRRESPVYSPDECVVRLVAGGVGATGGAEVILATPDNRWAFRYRHVRGVVRVGQRVARGELVAFVYDESMDWLGQVPPGFPAPDNYQHLDLSVNQGTDQFPQQGGSGGNTNAFDWLQSRGYQGTVVLRTPGPGDASRPFTTMEAIRPPEETHGPGDEAQVDGAQPAGPGPQQQQEQQAVGRVAKSRQKKARNQ